MKRLDSAVKVVLQIIVLALAIWMVYGFSNRMFSPAPYELIVIGQKDYILCPGQTLEYVSKVDVRRTPLTLVRTDSWFSEEIQGSIVADTYDKMEVINWDNQVVNVTPRQRTTVVPMKTARGEPMLPGKYRYIVHLNAWAEPTPSSISFNVTIPDNCS